MVDARFRVGTARANVHLNVVQNSTGNMRMLDNCVRWFKVSLRTLTTTDSCLTHIPRLHRCRQSHAASEAWCEASDTLHW